MSTIIVSKTLDIGGLIAYGLFDYTDFYTLVLHRKILISKTLTQ